MQIRLGNTTDLSRVKRENQLLYIQNTVESLTFLLYVLLQMEESEVARI